MGNKRNSIFLKDETPGTIYLAWVFIESIINAGYQLYLEPNIYKKHESFFKLFSSVSFKKTQPDCDLTVVFTEKQENEQIPDTLFYPIIIQKDFHEIISDGSIPVSIQGKAKDSYCQPELQTALDYIEKHFAATDFSGKKVLVSAGPTAEDIDPVRFLTNRSTGKMGIALAREAFVRGAEVRLILGPVHIEYPVYLKKINVRNASRMHKAVLENIDWCDYFLSAAAVADYTPLAEESEKLKKGNDNLFLQMKRTKDILSEIQKKKHQKIIGFSVETTDLVYNSGEKLQRKNLDMIIANNPKNPGAGFATETNQVEIITSKKHLSLPLLSKRETAGKILDFLKQMDE
jgi:phosphopantothenoylcysteine decarboxylase/phosphopantothenate--cysteine ligase